VKENKEKIIFLRKKGVKMKSSGVFSKTVENIGLEQEKTGRFVN